MAPTDGVVVALAFTLGALFGRRQAEAGGASRGLAELVKSGKGGAVPGGVELRPMTEEERIADENRRAERRAEKERREAEATKKRKEDEA